MADTRKREFNNDEGPDAKKVKEESIINFNIPNNIDINQFIEDLNIYKCLRMLIPTDVSEIIESNIPILEKDDNVIMVLPKTTSFERNLFIKPSNMDLSDDEIYRNLANVAARVGTLIQTVVFEKHNKNNMMKEGDIQIRILVYTKHVWNTIGPKGSKINQFQTDYNIQIDFSKIQCPDSSDKCCILIGKPEAVFKSTEKILVDNAAYSIDRNDNIREFYDANKANTYLNYNSFRIGAPDTSNLVNTPEDLKDLDFTQFTETKPCCIRFIIPSQIAGAFIGKGGQTAKQMEAEYSTKIKCTGKQSNDRVVEVSSTTGFTHQNILNCVAKMANLLAGPMKTVLRESNSKFAGNSGTSFKLLCHYTLLSIIIGKGGATIKQLRSETSTKIEVYDECCPGSTDKVWELSGSVKDIMMAVAKMTKIMLEGNIKGLVNNYQGVINPMYNKTCKEYGGFITEYAKMGGGYRGGGYNNGYNMNNMNMMPMMGGMNMMPMQNMQNVPQNYGGLNMGGFVGGGFNNFQNNGNFGQQQGFQNNVNTGYRNNGQY